MRCSAKRLFFVLLRAHFSCEKTPRRSSLWESAHVKGRFVLKRAMCVLFSLFAAVLQGFRLTPPPSRGEQNATNVVVMTLYDSQRKGCFYFCRYTLRVSFQSHSLVKLCLTMRLSYSMIRLNWVKRGIFGLKCTLMQLEMFSCGVFQNREDIGIKNKYFMEVSYL